MRKRPQPRTLQSFFRSVAAMLAGLFFSAIAAAQPLERRVVYASPAVIAPLRMAGSIKQRPWSTRLTPVSRSATIAEAPTDPVVSGSKTALAVSNIGHFDRSVVTVRDGNPTLLVDGQPFFFFGAAFFYERIPASRWRASMLALRELGFNTLDLYVPWNWHELADGDFDFDGHTNDRRALRTVLALARELHFRLLVRPGPVIRNEWRNGGYPAWLLTRPEYGMPLHDILEGRYPATATLQNANSDDAAAQWMHNATHMRYATRWLQTVLREFAPVADLVIAVQLDDDQGAYIDNQTWPAPNLQTYLRQLEAIVRSVVGPQLPVFINTYEMKVTASAPVWAMGNWYQSDAYSIGEHDRAALEFSTGLLQTQTRWPVAMSEFQAGWLAPPEDPAPRAVDPSNTTLALHTLLGMGARGVVDFPAQDTIDPAGWEAPFANEAYAWDAALDVNLLPTARYTPTKRFGTLLRDYGSELAGARRVADGAIAYLASAYDETRLTTTDVFGIVARTQEAQRDCRRQHLTCDLVDLRYTTDAALGRYPFLVVPKNSHAAPFTPAVRERLRQYGLQGGQIVDAAPGDRPSWTAGLRDATLLVARADVAFLDIVNYADDERTVPATQLRLPSGRLWTVGPFGIKAHDAVLLREPQRAPPKTLATVSTPDVAVEPPCPQPPYPVLPHGPPFAAATMREDDSAADGYARVTLANDFGSVTVTPNAGGRSFSFTQWRGACSLPHDFFTSVGALRDDVALQPPLSTTDRIGKYTRSFPAGTFNRPYVVESRSSRRRSASVTLAYDAPDVVPNGARFVKTLTVDADMPGFRVNERATFRPGPNQSAQRAVRYDSFDTRGATIVDDRTNGAVGFFFANVDGGRVAIVAWPHADIESAELLAEATSTVLRLQFAPDRDSSTRYTFYSAADVEQARTLLLKERTIVSANR